MGVTSRDHTEGIMNTSFSDSRPESRPVPAAVGEGMATTPGSARLSAPTRKAGFWLVGAGGAVGLSSLFPWVSIDGMGSVSQSGGAVVMLLVIGGLLGFLGSRVLRGTATVTVLVGLWLVAAIDVALTLGLFSAAGKLSRASGPLVSAAPAIGFYLAIGGFIAGVMGTVLTQIARLRKVPPASGGTV